MQVIQKTRRDFIKDTATLAGTAVGLTAAEALVVAQETTPDSDIPNTTIAIPTSTRKGDMLYRPLGRTGEQVSIIGMGGFHLGKQKDEQESIRLIRSAIDRGINFLDNSWDYNSQLPSPKGERLVPLW